MRSSQAISQVLRASEKTDRHLKRRRLFDKVAEALILGFASIAIAIILLIFIYVGKEALPLVWENVDGASIAATFTPPTTWLPVSSNPSYNVIPLLLGTLKVTLI